MKRKIVAVIPTWNEEKNVGRVVKEARKYVDEVIVVIDGCIDNSLKVAKKAGAVIVDNKINRGLGYTLRRGSEEAAKRGADIIITLDSDGQHNPTDIKKLTDTLIKYDLDVVIGSRPHDDNMPPIKKFGNWGLALMSRLFFGSLIVDTQSGFKAFTPKAYRKIKWKADRYSVCSEIAMRIAANNLKFKEVTIKTIYGTGHGTSVIDVTDGFKIGMSMLKWRLFGFK